MPFPAIWIPACAGMTQVEAGMTGGGCNEIGRGGMVRASPAKFASLFRAPFALRKGRGFGSWDQRANLVGGGELGKIRVWMQLESGFGGGGLIRL